MEEKMSDENIPEENNKTIHKGDIPSSGNKLNTSNALLAIVAVLVIMSGLQVFQTQKLLKAVSSGAVKVNAQTQGGSIGLPSQVGGCG